MTCWLRSTWTKWSWANKATKSDTTQTSFLSTPRKSRRNSKPESGKATLRVSNGSLAITTRGVRVGTGTTRSTMRLSQQT